MSKVLTFSLALSLLFCTPMLRAQEDSSYQPFSPEQLDNLLAPVALYPDPLLAQVLPAATFPDQIDEAARFCRAGANPDAIDAQPWDVSVKAVAHYPTVLYVMADGLDWTTALGQAYVNQPDDVMASIQRLREEARNAGNLVTTPQQDVETDDGDIEIWPAQPEYCYVPVYDPGVVFFGSGGVFGGPLITFGTPYPIGVWLNHNFDWRHHRIYYHGWSEGRGWVARSRPYIHTNPVYVNNNLQHVTVNRTVTARPVSYANLTRYNSVHRNETYGNPRGAGAGNVTHGGDVQNKIIQRNTNVNDARLNLYRGRAEGSNEAGAPEPNRARPGVPAAPPPRVTERPANPAFGGTRGPFDARTSSQRGQSSRSEASRPAPAARPSGGGGSHAGGGGSHGGGGGSHGGGGGGSHGGGGKH